LFIEEHAMPLTIRHSESAGKWMERSDRRQSRDVCLLDPGSRRRRALLILLATRNGFSVADLAEWLTLSESRVYVLKARVERFAEAIRDAG